LLSNLTTLKKDFRRVAPTALALGNLREVTGEFVFLDDEKMIAIGFDQSQLRNLCMKKLIRGASSDIVDNSSWNLQLDADTARVLLAHGAGQLQQRLASRCSLSAVTRWR